MKPDDVKNMLGIVALPADIRAEAIAKLIGDRAGEVLNDFIGLMLQKDQAVRDFVELYLTAECGHYPQQAEKINLPTTWGALHGLTIARPPVRGMCHSCAFRQGTPANMSPVTSCDAAYSRDCEEPFMCHHGLDGEGSPTRTCAGSAAAKPGGKP